MENRRHFIKKVALGSLALGTLNSFAKESKNWTKLTILHTNDMHSRIEPFPADHKKHPNQGGMARRAALIKKIRSEESHVLLLDAGDIFQGTPYFNVYGGALEFELMSQMGYDAATMGNHDFDNGLEGFDKMLPKANFPFICSNYDFSDTLLEGKTKPYAIVNKGGINVGIIGLGVELEGLVDAKNYGNTKYMDPVETANNIAAMLKSEKKCDFVICLSHLGYAYEQEKISDLKLAPKTRYIDLILGGHTHTYLETAKKVNNLDGNNVLINQVGWAGISLGRIEVLFRKKKVMDTSSRTPLNIKKECERV